MNIGFFDTTSTDDVTLHGLEKWTCNLYENLGWMTLSYESNNQDKISSYLISIEKLKSSIESRFKIVTSEDAKIDLTRLLTKITHLNSIANKLFDKRHVKKTICEKCALPVKTHNDSIKSNDLNPNQNGGNKKSKSIKSIKSTGSTKPINILKMSKGYSLEDIKKLSKKKF